MKLAAANEPDAKHGVVPRPINLVNEGKAGLQERVHCRVFGSIMGSAGLVLGNLRLAIRGERASFEPKHVARDRS